MSETSEFKDLLEVVDTENKSDIDKTDDSDESLNNDSKKHIQENGRKGTDSEIIEVIDLMGSSLTTTDYVKTVTQKLKTIDVKGASEYLLTCKNVVFMTGAGISTSAGIPDFRSPVTGLYANLAKYDLPFPEAVFCLDFFEKDPQPFYTLSKELMPKDYRPTVSHYFQKLLIEKGHVRKVYTQNIDALETIAEIPKDKLITAHGSFERGHCYSCKHEYSFEWMKKNIEELEYLKCENLECLSDMDVNDSLKIVKPDITFFGEQLPDAFMKNYAEDLTNCDLLIVMGTSLKVQPFGLLSQMVDDDCPRILINRDLVGDFIETIECAEYNYRDVFLQGNCDDGCLELAKHLGYLDDLLELIKKDNERIDRATKEE